MGTLTITEGSYGPNPFFILQGGLYHYRFTVNFEGAPPPEEFTYRVVAARPDHSVLREWSDTVPTDGQSSVQVNLAVPLQLEGGQRFPFGPFYNRFEVSIPEVPGLQESESWPPVSERICSGTPVVCEQRKNLCPR